MKKKTIRMGVIGLGGIARYAHIPGIQRSPDAELVAVCDIVPEKLEAAAKDHGLDPSRCFLEYESLLECPDVDAVTICTPNDLHVPIALAAVAHGKPFAVEKPLSVDAKSAKRLHDAVKAANIPSMVCFSYRFKAAARHARDLIAAGRIGTLRHVYACYVQSWGNPKRNCPRVWRFDAKASGSGALGDLGSHALDLVRFITGLEYESLVAQNGTFTHQRRSPDPAQPETLLPVDVDDYSHCLAQMEGGVGAVFAITRNAFGRGNFQRMEFYGDNGGMIYELEHEDSLSVCFKPDQEKNHRYDRVTVPAKYRCDQMQTFFNIVNGRRRDPGATIEDGYRNQLCLDAILKSAKTGRAQSVKD
ncbi:MAG: Gfo/Idh/MocA family protein [Kiritimatiellia bacterium]